MKPLSRRAFLRGSGVALALPFLDGMVPAVSAATKKAAVPRRLICVMQPLGMDHSQLYPKEAGRLETLSPYLEVLKEFRNDLTVFSGTSHPEVNDGHASEHSFLTGAPHPSRAGFRNSISLDQVVAERIGSQTRFPYIAMNIGGPSSLSWTRSGIAIPPDSKPSEVFARLFLNGSPEAVRAQVQKLSDGQSVMDAVLDQAKSMQNKLGPRDQQKLEQYFQSVREVEKQLISGQAWATKPKPEVKAPTPKDIVNPADLIGRTRLWLDLVHLAVQTDSSRVFTIHAGGNNGAQPPIPGVKHGWHGLSHTLSIPENRAEIRLIETEFFKALRDLMVRLQAAQEDGATLLDRSMVLYGSNLHDGNHGNKNLPVLLAGGGFRHGSHLAFDPNKNLPLCRLYVSMLQRLGIEMDKFSSGNGTIAGLEMKG
jgi:hypothetical protein